MSLYQAEEGLGSLLRQVSGVFAQVRRQLRREFVASLGASLSQVHPQISPQGDILVGWLPPWRESAFCQSFP
jgi:hypothetical protein